jgi:hypothetical protein
MIKITKPGSDIIVITDQDYNKDIRIEEKVHLIRLAFDIPTIEKMNWVIDTFYKTHRFIIDSEHIRFYNGFFKRTNKKYYVINDDSTNGLISFFKKNNKVLLDITALNEFDKMYVLNVAFNDILKNTEVIIISKDDYTERLEQLNMYNGNCVIADEDYPI